MWAACIRNNKQKGFGAIVIPNEIKDNEYFLWKKNNVKEKIKDCQEFPFKAFLEYCAKCSLKDLEIALLPYVAFLKNAGKEKGDYYLYLEEAKNFINDYNERNEK